MPPFVSCWEDNERVGSGHLFQSKHEILSNHLYFYFITINYNGHWGFPTTVEYPHVPILLVIRMWDFRRGRKIGLQEALSLQGV